MVEYARQRLSRLLACSGAPLEEVEQPKFLFDPSVDARFCASVCNLQTTESAAAQSTATAANSERPERPVQLIIAGKAHPADKAGQEMIHQWVQFIPPGEVRPHLIFLSDYDMLLTEHLVQGVDVWINTPRRPWEASGTSGM